MVNPLDVPARLDEFRLLKDGWLEGHGKAPDHCALDRLAAAFTLHYPQSLPLPYTYPTESGGIQFEWHLERLSPEVDIDLGEMRGQWRAFDSANAIDEEAVIDLATAEGWADLSRRISACLTAEQSGARQELSGRGTV